MDKQKKDFSYMCNHNDDDETNPCWECAKFCFPIGCMLGVEDDKND